MSEFLGSRISLISKSDIRYVGVLHEINSDESTVSLENVRSFGTEGRKGRPEEEVGPSEQVYEYIVFRGSDVKDLRIEEHPGIKENKPPAMPDDLAIVGATRNRPGPQGPNQQAPPAGPYGQPYPPNNFYGPPGSWGRGGPPPGPGPGPQGFGNMPYPPPPGWFPPPGQGFPPGPGGPAPWGNQPFPPGAGGPGAEGAPNQRGPAGPGQQDGQSGPGGPGTELGGSPAQTAAPTESKSLAQQARPAANAPTPPVESKPSTEEVINAANNLVDESSKAAKAPGAAKAAATGPQNNRVNPVIPLGSVTKPFQPPIAQRQAGQSSVQTTVTAGPPNSVQDATSAAKAAVAVAMASLGGSGGNAMDNLSSKVNEMRVSAGRGGAPRGRGRGGRGPAAKVEVPNSDFNFMESNAKFNKEDVVKEAIAGSPLTETPNGTAPAPVEQPASTDDVPVAYNKSRSFFDNISSEAKDRADSNGPKPGGREWRSEEQRRNMETFGQGSVDGGHRNYRGRGRGRGRGGRGRGFSRGGRGGNRPPYQEAEI